MGLEKQLQLLIEKVNRLRAALAVEADVSTKYKYEHDLAVAEAEKRELSEKLSESYNIHSPKGRSLLGEKIRELDFDEQLGPLYLVNVNREQMKDRFWREFDERGKESFQFYFISACPTQMPASFSERMIYELIVEELEDKLEAIHCHPRENSARLKIHDLPLGRKLEYCQREFAKFLAEYFDLAEAGSLEQLVSQALSTLDYEYVALVFDLQEHKWKDFLPDYFKWIIRTFAGRRSDAPRFIFFFVLYLEELHSEAEQPAKNAILQSLRDIVEQEPAAALLSPLGPVPVSDLRYWFQDVGEKNPAKVDQVLETLAKGLKGKDLEQYRRDNKLNMDDIEELQEIVLEAANKK
jgi:hypothetical protein